MDPPQLTIAIEERDDIVVLSVAGEIDLVTSIQLKRSLDDLLQRSPPAARITVDLAGVGFMDTTGVAVLLTARTRANEVGSRFAVSRTSPLLARLFDVTGIGRVLSDESV